MGQILVRQGNFFDVRADLVVFPCTTDGIVSATVRMYLDTHQLPNPTPSKPGTVSELIDFSKFPEKANHIVYASSVINNSSSPEIIENIARQLAAYTHLHDDIRSIEAPLLGTGMGGLKNEVAAIALRRGFEKYSHPDSKLIVFVFDQGRYASLSNLWTREDIPLKYDEIEKNLEEIQELLKEFDAFAKKIAEEGGVFISYSRADSDIVKEVAIRFDNAKIPYWLDKKDIRIGEIIDDAISKGIYGKQFFLVFLTPSSIDSKWVEREIAEATHEEIEGRKIVLPVVAKGLTPAQIPQRLKRKLYIDLTHDFEAGFAKLLSDITDYLDEWRKKNIFKK